MPWTPVVVPPRPDLPPIKGNALTGVRCSIEPGSGNYHFRLVDCDDCTVRDLLNQTLAQVQHLYRTGYVTQDHYEAYCHVWATGAPRLADYHGWTDPPTDPNVTALVVLYRIIRNEREESS